MGTSGRIHRARGARERWTMAPTTSSPRGWLSCDSVAATYEAAAVPRFTPLARDYVVALAPSPHEIVLDVGTGTGLIARTITETEPLARVVGVDPSRAMLAVARATTGGHVAATAAMAPGLPFRDGTFAAVVANLSSPTSPTATADSQTSSGCCAHTAGSRAAPGQPPPRRRPTTSAPRCGADRGPDPSRPRHRPDSARPSRAVGRVARDPDQLRAALSDAGLAALTPQLHEYHHALSVPQFLAGWGSRDRYLRHTVGEQRWRHFVARARTALRRTFGAAIPAVSHAWIATGTQ